MLILIFIDVQYLQKVVFNFELVSNGQNHSSLGPQHPINPPEKFLIPPHSLTLFENPGHVGPHSKNIT